MLISEELKKRDKRFSTITKKSPGKIPFSCPLGLY
jgi:hypothetical protein